MNNPPDFLSLYPRIVNVTTTTNDKKIVYPPVTMISWFGTDTGKKIGARPSAKVVSTIQLPMMSPNAS